MKKFRIALLLYVAFDFLILGNTAGLLPLTPMLAAQTSVNIPNFPPIRATPDCLIQGSFTATGTSTIYDNRGNGCTTWHLVYSNTGYSALNIALQSADDSGGTPSAFANWGTSGGTLASGTTLPLTATTSGQATGYKYRPYVQVNLSSATGSGRVWYMAYGYRPGIADSSGISGFGSPTTTSGTASAVTQPGYPMICDTATSGTVTAGQAQMVRCNPAGVLTIMNTQAWLDGVTNGTFGNMLDASGSARGLWVAPFVYNGVSADRPRSASLTNFPASQTLTARNTIGAAINEKGSRWSVISNPAAGSQATASIASEASVRHVVDCVSFSAAATTAPALTALTVNVRDGATGAGTIIWTYQTTIAAATGQSITPHSICGLNLVGTTATAMTLEFSASLANLVESVSISGYNVN